MKRPTFFDVIKWHPNGVVEQQFVDDLYIDISNRYASIMSKLDYINLRIKQLREEVGRHVNAEDRR